MPHQQALLHRCMEIEKKMNKCGVLNDIPGSGKTFVVLALICKDLFERDTSRADGMRRKLPVHRSDKTIIVVPFNIHTQWMNATCVCCKDVSDPANTVRVKAFVEYSDISSLLYSPAQIRDNDVLVTTSMYYASIADIMTQEGYAVKRVIMDEVDRIGNMIGSMIAPCAHLWLVSASLKSLRDCRLFGSAVNDLVAGDCLREISAACEETFVRNSFNIPKPDIMYIISKETHVDIMRGVLSDEAIDAMNACAFNDARIIENDGDSYGKTVTSANELLSLLLKDRNDNINILESEIRSLGCDDSVSEQKSALEKKLHGHMDFVRKMTERLQEHGVCCICMESFQEDQESEKHVDEQRVERNESIKQVISVVGCCLNRFCSTCLKKWACFNDKCPMCRATLDSLKMWTIGSAEHKKCVEYLERKDRERREQQEIGEQNQILDFEYMKWGRECPYNSIQSQRSSCENKTQDVIDIVRRIMREYNTHSVNRASTSSVHPSASTGDPPPPKILIFSDKVDVFASIMHGLRDIGITFSELDGGNVKAMDAIIDRYKSDAPGSLSVIMVNSTLFDCGMNLENTTDLILVHYIQNSLKEEQVMGRAQRFGRKKRLMIWQLFHENEAIEHCRDKLGGGGDRILPEEGRMHRPLSEHR